MARTRVKVDLCRDSEVMSHLEQLAPVLGQGGAGSGPCRGRSGLTQRMNAPVLGRAGAAQRMNSRWSKQKEATRIREGEAGSQRAEDELVVEHATETHTGARERR
jgi:hypothetical protein